MTHHTPYQQGIIKRFYENRDHIAVQKLGEIVSNLYLEENETKIKRHWAAAAKHLKACGIDDKNIKALCDDRDLGALADLLGKVF